MCQPLTGMFTVLTCLLYSDSGDGEWKQSKLMQMNVRVKPLINDHLLKTTSVQRPLLYKIHFHTSDQRKASAHIALTQKLTRYLHCYQCIYLVNLRYGTPTGVHTISRNHQISLMLYCDPLLLYRESNKL